MVTEIVSEPSDVGRYLQVAVLVPEPATVLIAVQPEIALLLARNVTLDGVFTRAAIGLFCRKTVVIATMATSVVGVKPGVTKVGVKVARAVVKLILVDVTDA
jgi:hypothetical protein